MQFLYVYVKKCFFKFLTDTNICIYIYIKEKYKWLKKHEMKTSNFTHNQKNNNTKIPFLPITFTNI